MFWFGWLIFESWLVDFVNWLVDFVSWLTWFSSKSLSFLFFSQVPDGATVALIPRSQSSLGVNQVYQTGESKLNTFWSIKKNLLSLHFILHFIHCVTHHLRAKMIYFVLISGLLLAIAVETPMLEGEEEEGLRLWHLVKPSEDAEIPKHRKSSMRERERAKAIPEIYLTRLLSMKVRGMFVIESSLKRHTQKHFKRILPLLMFVWDVSSAADCQCDWKLLSVYKCVSSGHAAEICRWCLCSHTEYETASTHRRQILLWLPGRHGRETRHRWPRDRSHLENKQVGIIAYIY